MFRMTLPLPLALYGVALCALVVSACAPAEAPTPTRGAPAPITWGEDDRPEILLDDQMETRFAMLPLEGEATRIPWAGSYWPTYKDSVNDRWAGPMSMSPSEKYAAAFGLEGLPDQVSAVYGVDSLPDATPCTTDSECNATKGEKCSKRRGQSAGRCIETWFGICHAWGPAAVVEDEPRQPVTRNGVEFRINDIKALVTLSYDEGLPQKVMALRCDKTATGEGGVTYDEFGRPVEADKACADTNAGSFHIVITNMLGLRREAIVEDRTYDYEVWNQPIRGYRITRSEEVDAATANGLVGAPAMAPYRFNDAAVSFHHVEMEMGYIFESHQEQDAHLADEIDDYTGTDRYSYVLELDGEGRIIGGEWVGDSKRNHPDFLWRPLMKQDTEVARRRDVLATVNGAVAANAWSNVGRWDVVAGERVHVKMKGDGDADLYVRFGSRPWLSRHDCRPVLTGTEETCTLVVPEGQTRVYAYTRGFAPTSNYTVQVDVERAGTGIRWSVVESLLEESLTVPAEPPPPEPMSATEMGQVGTREWRHFGPFVVGSGPLEATLQTLDADGDADLYVRAGAQPTAEQFDCRPWAGGQTAEICAVSGAEVYVSVYGYQATAFQLSLRWTPPPAEAPPPAEPQPAPQMIALDGAVEKQQWQQYGPYTVTEGALTAGISGLSADVDLYVRRGEPPTAEQFDCRPWLEGAVNESCTVSGQGQFYIGVFGYAAGRYRLEASFTGLP